jgi:uncharacterized membrane protein
MAKKEPETTHENLSKSRLEALTDGVFAFAMTLLILAIAVPHQLPKMGAGDPIVAFIASMLPSLAQFVIAFVVLAAFWVTHHLTFDRIRHVDRNMIWLNLLGLLFIVFIPFSTQIADNFGSYPSASIVFEANILAVGLVYFVQWRYACRMSDMAVCPADPVEYALSEKRILVMPGVSLLAIIVALAGSPSSTWLYAHLPFLYILFTKKN